MSWKSWFPLRVQFLMCCLRRKGTNIKQEELQTQAGNIIVTVTGRHITQTCRCVVLLCGVTSTSDQRGVCTLSGQAQEYNPHVPAVRFHKDMQ